MFTTDSLFFLVLFLIPGAVKIIYDSKLAKYPHKEPDEKLRMAMAALFAFVIFAINAALFHKEYTAFVEQESIFEPFYRILCISLLNVGVSLVAAFACDGCISLWFKMRNFFSRKKGASTREMAFSARQYAFSDDATGNGPQAVRYIKDGASVVGFLGFYNLTDGGSPNFTLVHCQEISEYFEVDKNKPPEERVFHKEKYTYVDAENGYHLVFYDMERYNAFQEEPISYQQDHEEAEAEPLVYGAPDRHNLAREA